VPQKAQNVKLGQGNIITIQILENYTFEFYDYTGMKKKTIHATNFLYTYIYRRCFWITLL